MNKVNVLLVGDKGVGKTAFINRFRGDHYEMKCVPSINNMVDYKEVKLNMLDNVGELPYTQQYNYYKNANVVIAVFSVDQKTTFKNLRKWIYNVKLVNREAPIILVGNKCDLQREILPQEVGEYYDFPYFEASTKDNINFEEIMEHVISH